MYRQAGKKTLLLFLLLFSAANVHTQTGSSPVKPLTLAEAIELALNQASNFRSAGLNEKIAAEDIIQAKAAFLPKVTGQPNYTYTSPSLNNSTNPRPPSFLGADAINVYQGLINAAGELDTSGKLRATLRKNQALLESARAGSEVAKRDLIQAVQDAYFNFALATVKRRGAEANLESAGEFENNTKLQLDAGEVAPIDLTRARLQTANRRDELEQAKTDEAVSANGLRFLVGYDPKTPIEIEDLLSQVPVDGDIENYTETAVKTRPEFAQFAADKRAAEEDANIAKADRRPQFNYSVSGGFISDSLTPVRIKDTLGVQVNVGVTIPIFDWGDSRSREAQAKLKIGQTENARQMAERGFMRDFYTARTQAIAARLRIRQLAQSITDAEQILSTSLARYRAGEALITEVTEAQNALITQRQTFYQALFDYQTARARLLRAIGQ
jgi:outer membrane protein TolC